MLRYQSEGTLLDEVCRLVESIERNARLEVPVSESAKDLAGTIYVAVEYRRCTRHAYGGGGGEDSRRRCLGFGLPLGNDEFLCVRN